MKKLLALLLLLILFIISLFTFLIFHDKGNELIKPHLSTYLSTYLKSELKQEVELKIEDLKIDMDTLQCTLTINGLTRVQLKGDLSLLEKKEKIVHNIQVEINQGDIEELLRIGKQNHYAKGKVDIEIKIPTLKESQSKGVATVKLYNVLLNEKVIKKELDIELPSQTVIDGTIETNLDGNNLTTKGKLQTTLANLDFDKAQYNLKSKILQSDYHINIEDLSRLRALNNRKLQGAMQIKGSIYKDKNLTIKGIINDLDGEIKFTLIDKKLKALISDVSVQKIIHTVNYPQIFKANLTGELNYDLTDKQGIFTSKLDQAQLLPNQLTNLVKKFQGADLTKDRYNETTFNAKFNKNIMGFDFHAKSETTELKLYPATINSLNNTINANYTIEIDNKDVGGKIKGKVNDPNITIDSSKFIQREVMDKVKEYIKIDDETLEKIGIGEKEKEAVKDLFRGFFR